jgi:hypothetical protein
MKKSRLILMFIVTLCACSGIFAQTQLRMGLAREGGRLEIYLNDVRIQNEDTFEQFMKKMAKNRTGNPVTILVTTNVMASDLLQVLGTLQRCGMSNSILHGIGNYGTNSGRWYLAVNAPEGELPRRSCVRPGIRTGFYARGENDEDVLEVSRYPLERIQNWDTNKNVRGGNESPAKKP